MTATREPLFQVTYHGDAVTARARWSDLTEIDAAALDRELAALVRSPAVTIDLAAVTFLGSMAVGRLAALNHTIRAAGGRLTLVNLTPHVREVVALCGLGRVFNVRAVEVGPSNEAVRVLAHRKWEEAGCPGGDGAAFWRAAERELTPVV